MKARNKSVRTETPFQRQLASIHLTSTKNDIDSANCRTKLPKRDYFHNNTIYIQRTYLIIYNFLPVQQIMQSE